jgi:hypothetical protein
MSDLETLIPQAVELVIDGEPLAIKPLKVGQMPAFLRAISPVMQQITAMASTGWRCSASAATTCCRPSSIAVGKPRAWVDELAADEAILLAAKVIEVNADFFTRTVMPEARRSVRADEAASRWRLVRHRPAPDRARPPVARHPRLHPGAGARLRAATAREDAARDARLLSLIAIGARGDARHLDQTLDRLQDHAHLDPHR